MYSKSFIMNFDKPNSIVVIGAAQLLHLQAQWWPTLDYV